LQLPRNSFDEVSGEICKWNDLGIFAMNRVDNINNTDMNAPKIDSLHYKKHPELDPYFNSTLFNSIIISTVDKTATMMDSGYLSNLTIKFWRLLQINKLLKLKKGDADYCDFLLEIFLNQSLSCTDTLATCLNHFLKLGLSGSKLAIHKEDFLKELKHKLSGFPDVAKLESCHDWIKTKLYPYRNIVHHMGESSGYVQMSKDNRTVECCLTLKESEWDFVAMRKELKNYPSHTAWLIATNNMNLPNIITGSNGDEHKYLRIDTFFDEWIRKVFEVIEIHIEGLVWYQKQP
jgi:hypothetical protein